MSSGLSVHNIDQLTTIRTNHENNFAVAEIETRCSCGYYGQVNSDPNMAAIVKTQLDVVHTHRLLVVCEALGLRFPVKTYGIEYKGFEQ